MVLDNVQGIEAPPRKAKYGDAMLDLETLGVGTDAAVVSVGLVCFDEDGPDLGASLHLSFRPAYGNDVRFGKIELGTVKWWLQQSHEARSGLIEKIEAGDSPIIVCQSIIEFAKHFDVKRLWSNGPSFDERLLHELFDRCGPAWPFAYNAGRDYRTIRDVGAALNVTEVPRAAGVAHDALSDAVHQANNVVAVLRALRG